MLAGLQTIPEEVLEAAEIDGASPLRRYFSVILPILRPAIAVATIINIINVFNSLPILQTMTGSIPGYDADTTTTRIFKMIQADRQIDTASALSVVNFADRARRDPGLPAHRAPDAGGLMAVTDSAALAPATDAAGEAATAAAPGSHASLGAQPRRRRRRVGVPAART